MRGWIEGVQASIDFIERNLTEPPDIEEIAGKAALSPFYYQRIFGAVCGMTVGEYIRVRRMTLAAQELAGAGVRVIDVAVKYGYDSPDSFAKAFQRFHDIVPSQAREPGASLRSLSKSHWRVEVVGLSDHGKAPFYRRRHQEAVQHGDKLSGDTQVLGDVDVRQEGLAGPLWPLPRYGREEL